MIVRCCLVVLIGLQAAAHAQSEAVALAKIHFRAGEALYRQADYAGAAREWEAGYDLAPRPEFLINLGQAYRQMNRPAKALASFEKYLAATALDDPRRKVVEQLAAEVRAMPQPPPEPTPAPPPSPAASTSSTPAAAPAASTVTAILVAAPPPPPKRSFARRHWWIFPVVGAVVAAGVGVGVYFATHSPNVFTCGNAVLCADARPK